ncbi:hypothetical protein PISMIDRAFT_600985 [Pisolithus microcarpus 441]|uniref:Uncharacterized protein n=1 Tax=Pisolithus microcarpus 441 TaxID=765257 RepID=A0A0C9ZCD7_9AGAM|nr:hypothetical protein BKA83DRAFT_600985 [Pisolithus microcarpus]KIK20082.1 hypothetical protein PISMIDRAFT_600985 [Pisolithus microcarpus 441]
MSLELFSLFCCASEFPSDLESAESLLLDLGTTHLLSISSAQLPKPNLPPTFEHCFIDVPNNAREALLLELPTACRFISDAIQSGKQVLIQCRVELRACIVACAYRESFFRCVTCSTLLSISLPCSYCYLSICPSPIR